MKNFRNAPRISTDLQLVSRNSGNSVDSRILNMSSGGVFIKTDHLLPVDAEFSLHLELPGDPDVMTLRARVVWTKSVASASPAGMGIQFVDISPEHEKKIVSFVSHLSKDQNSGATVRMYV